MMTFVPVKSDKDTVLPSLSLKEKAGALLPASKTTLDMFPPLCEFVLLKL
jgi:hypothetical protein